MFGLFHLSYYFLAAFAGHVLAFPQLEKACCRRIEELEKVVKTEEKMDG